MKDGVGLLGGGGSIVEADEAWIVPKRSNKKLAERDRNKVVSLVQRDGKTRTFHVANIDAENLRPILLANVAADSHLMTDGAQHYRKIGKEFSLHEYEPPARRVRQAVKGGRRVGALEHRRVLLRHPEARHHRHVPSRQQGASAEVLR